MRRLILLVALMGCATGTYRDTSIEMESVARLDLARYEGLWYEIARFPNSFEEGCTGVTAEYAQRPDGRIGVVNTCRQGALDGPVEVAEATARVVAPGQLKVKFVQWLPFEGDYWVTYVDEAYSVVAVAEPKGNFGWILAREPQPAEAAIALARAALAADGYDLERLILTEQFAR
ncbi:MAG: lipocalin family protein [Pseudomonadota bacterium]